MNVGGGMVFVSVAVRVIVLVSVAVGLLVCDAVGVCVDVS